MVGGGRGNRVDTVVVVGWSTTGIGRKMGSAALADAVPYPGKVTRIPNEFHARNKEVTKKKEKRKKRLTDLRI